MFTKWLSWCLAHLFKPRVDEVKDFSSGVVVSLPRLQQGSVIFRVFFPFTGFCVVVYL